MKTEKVVALVVDEWPKTCGDCKIFHFNSWNPSCAGKMYIDFNAGNPPDWCPLQELEVVCDE